jgi:hypothetical protein
VNELKISPNILRKLLLKHSVKRLEVEQCLVNRTGRLLMDTREKHKTDPPTLWFIALTNQSRVLKIVYIQIDSTIHLKSAFSPNETEIEIYSRYG